MDGKTIADASILLPPLQLRVFAIQPMPMSQAVVPNVGRYAEHLLQSLGSSTSAPFLPLPDVPQQLCSVPLPCTQLKCVSCLHPSTVSNYCVSENVQGSVVLKEQQCTLDSKLCDLVFLEPSLRVCVNFIDQSQDAQCANKQQSLQPGVQTRIVETTNTKHIFTACLPLSKVCQDLLEHGTCVHQSITSEDNNKTWQLHLCVADAASLSAQELRKRCDLLAKCRDTALVHKALVTHLHGYCKSLSEIVSEVSCCRETRKQANAAVLGQLTRQVMPTVWELQMSRPLNTCITDKGEETAKLSNEQLEFLREGAQSGGQLEQTMLLFVNSLVSTVVSNAQGANVLIAYDHANKAAMFDPLAFHQANHDFVREHGADALMQKLLYNCQQNICEQSRYGNDPAYQTCTELYNANLDNNGNGAVQVKTVLRLMPFSGEDQKISTGYGPADHGRLILDCEDSASGILSLVSVMRSTTEEYFVHLVVQAMAMMPPCTQQVTATVVDMARILHRQEAKNMQAMGAGSNTTVKMSQLTPQVLKQAVQRAQTQPSVRFISACSVLAKAPQISNISTATSRDSMLRDLNTTSGTFFNWWGTTSENGLNGHSVCVNMRCIPVLKTHVNNLPVHITLVLRDMDIVEGTGVAIQRQDACTAEVRLNLGCSSLQRVMLQQKLDNGVKLSPCLASCIKSSLHVEELRQHLNTTVNASRDLSVPTVSAIQSHSINGKANTVTERNIMINSMFYAVCLACGLGGLLSFDTDEPCKQPALMQVGNDMQLAEQRGEKTTRANTDSQPAANEISGPVLPGVPFLQDILPHNVSSVVVAATCSDTEKQMLRTLGAFMALGTLDAQSYLKVAPSSFTPLHLRQSMALCPVRKCLLPLTAAQLRDTQLHKCGIFISSPFVTPRTGERYTTAQEMENNMHLLFANTANVVGCLPVVTGSGCSDSMTIVYP